MPFVITRIKPPFHVVEQYVFDRNHPGHKLVREMHKPQEVHVTRLPRIGRVIVTFRDPSGELHTRAFSQTAATLRYVLRIVQEHKMFQIKPDLFIASGRKHPSFISIQKSRNLES